MSREVGWNLQERAATVEFYQDRFARGYADEWPPEKKKRVFELVRGLGLPETGEALDFGCGNGVFTSVLRAALPRRWTVYGTDLSENAVRNARVRYGDCVFLDAKDPALAAKRFDFLFSHHVLEHVYSLPDVLAEIDALLKPASSMLHVLPCGNEGSLEREICRLRKDGIDETLEGRFFFEDVGHLRRLSTERLASLVAEKGFALAEERYANQYHGAIDWITSSSPAFVRSFTDPAQATDLSAARRLRLWRRKLASLWLLRYPAAFLERRLRRTTRTVPDYALLAIVLPFYPFAKPADVWLKSRAQHEWAQSSRERNGSEMYLFFKRGPIHAARAERGEGAASGPAESLHETVAVGVG